jgi:hypothetical protein
MVHLGQLMLEKVVVVYISRAVGHPLRWHEQRAAAELIQYPWKHLLPLAENRRSEMIWTPEGVTLAVLLSLQKTTEDGDQNLNIITSSDGVFQSALSSKVTKKYSHSSYCWLGWFLQDYYIHKYSHSSYCCLNGNEGNINFSEYRHYLMKFR